MLITGVCAAPELTARSSLPSPLKSATATVSGEPPVSKYAGEPSGVAPAKLTSKSPLPLICPAESSVVVVPERCHHRGLDGSRDDHARVLADLEQPRDQCRVAGDKARAVAGEVGPLGQRVDREQALVRAAADVR